MTDLTLSSANLAEILPLLLEGQGCLSLRVTGYSMMPLLRHNRDTVWLRAPSGSISAGQILLFRRDNGKLVLHRVWKVLPEDRFQMNGDAQVWFETIRRDQILAEVSEIRRGERRIPCTGFLFRLQSSLWRLARPLRPGIFHLGQSLKQLLRR